MIKLTRPNGKIVLVNPNNITYIYVDDELDVVIELNNSDKITVSKNIPTIEDMILRDKFAMSAMNAAISAGWDYQSNSDMSEDAYKMADAMLKQRKEK